jgi:superfamily II DNA/RNA helicase
MPYPEIISVHPESQDPQDAVEPTGDDAIFSIPSTLREYAVAVKGHKPLHLLHLLNKYRLQDKTLIFAHSTETATRLNHLLSEFYKSTNSDISTAVISSEVPFKTRKKLLSSFIVGTLNMYISQKPLI